MDFFILNVRMRSFEMFLQLSFIPFLVKLRELQLIHNALLEPLALFSMSMKFRFFLL